MAEESRIEELKKLIEKSDEKIKLKGLLIDRINKDLELKKEEVESAQDKVAKLTSAKILTKKEREELEKQEAQILLAKTEEERSNIDSETKRLLKHAEKIREDARHDSEEEQRAADISALKTEIKALKKAVKILNDMLHEKERSAEDLLAENAVEESVIVKYKKEINALNLSRSDDKEFLSELREKMAECRKNKNHTHSLYLKFKKEAESVASKLFGYELKLAECLKRFESYGNI